MEVIVEKDYEGISKKAGKIVGDLIRKDPNSVLGFATGNTPIGLYKELIRMHKEEDLDFSQIKSFNLDEYIGLEATNPNSYRYFMDSELFDHINVQNSNIHVIDGMTEDPEKYCKMYDDYIDEAGGIDLQIVGIGVNGHIAFNEPAESLSVGTTIGNLSQATIEANAKFFHSMEDVPKTAITMGIGSILKAKKIILLANGKSKAEAIKKILVDRRITTKVPATMLLLHRDVTIILDEDAYSAVKEEELW